MSNEITNLQNFKDDNNGMEVQYNKENLLVFYNNEIHKAYVMDIRKEKNPLFKLELQSKIRKLVFNPFHKADFVILFSKSFIRMNSKTNEFGNYTFQEKKLLDFDFNKLEEEEFLICGDTNNPESHYFTGFLNVNQFPVNEQSSLDVGF